MLNNTAQKNIKVSILIFATTVESLKSVMKITPTKARPIKIGENAQAILLSERADITLIYFTSESIAFAGNCGNKFFIAMFR